MDIAPMAKLSPVEGQTDVGVNGLFVIRFDGPFEPATINESTLRWSDGQTVAGPSMVELARLGDTKVRMAIVTPDRALLASRTYTVTLEGARDSAGNVIPTVSSTFTTGAGPDLLEPRVLTWSPRYPEAPRNAAISVEFSEPVNPLTVHPDLILPDLTAPSGFTQIISADGRTITMLPNEPFQENARPRISLGPIVRNIAGNPLPSYPDSIEVSIGIEIDSTPPQLRLALPQDGAAKVDLNSTIVLQFDSEIRPSSLDPARILVTSGDSPIPIRMEISDRGRA